MDKYILVDAGTTQDRAFIENLKMSGKLEKIGLIILTHGHYDHVGYASILQEKFKIPIAMHFGDIEKRTCRMGYYPKQQVRFFLVRVNHGMMVQYKGRKATVNSKRLF